MTFGEKLAKLRRDNNYTQEQLADILGISRQSISKWESDSAYPETDKLITICELFNCSSDYLLLDASNSQEPKKTTVEATPRPKEWKSKKTVFGMPLWHVAKKARGFIAIGVDARGIISIGVKSCGVLSVGVLSLGLISIGTLSLGLLFSVGLFSGALFAVGTIAAGIFAVGAISFGMFSLGAIAVGDISVGALAVGRVLAIGDHAKGAIAVGKSYASGSVYSYLGSLTPEVREQVKALLDENAPSYLSWAVNFIKAFLF